MNPLSEVWLILQRELLRNFRSVKGIVLALLALLGGSGAAMLLVKFQQFKRTQLPDITPEHMKELREQALAQVYDPETAKQLSSSPEVLYVVLMLTVWLTPLLIVFLGFDNVSSELQHKAVRYWTVRTRRGSYFIGKFLGLFATVSLITLSMHVLIWVVCIARGEASAGETFAWGARFWATSLPMSAAWCAVATLVGSLFRQPFLALLMICVAFFSLWFLWAVGLAANVEGLAYVYPNYYDKLLLSSKAWTAAGGVAACLGFTVIGVGGGTLIFARRDV